MIFVAGLIRHASGQYLARLIKKKLPAYNDGEPMAPRPVLC